MKGLVGKRIKDGRDLTHQSRLKFYMDKEQSKVMETEKCISKSKKKFKGKSYLRCLWKRHLQKF